MPKRERSTATTSTLARVNQTAIIEALRGMGALSRQQLGALTGLSPATINRLTATLIEEGAVVQAGHVPSTGGRPAVLLRYAGGTRVVAAIQVRLEQVQKLKRPIGCEAFWKLRDEHAALFGGFGELASRAEHDAYATALTAKKKVKAG